MKREKLRSWYCKLLDKSKAEGVVERCVRQRMSVWVDTFGLEPHCYGV